MNTKIIRISDEYDSDRLIYFPGEEGRVDGILIQFPTEKAVEIFLSKKDRSREIVRLKILTAAIYEEENIHHNGYNRGDIPLVIPMDRVDHEGESGEPTFLYLTNTLDYEPTYIVVFPYSEKIEIGFAHDPRAAITITDL